MGGTVYRHHLDGWDVSWESSGRYRHWCLQTRQGHSLRVVVVMKNPGSLSGDGANLRRDTTLRILRNVGDAARIDWLVVNLFDYAAPNPAELHDNWSERDAQSLVFGQLNLPADRFVIFAHGDFNSNHMSDYQERLAFVRHALASLREISTPVTKAGNGVHPINWQRMRLMPQVVAGIDARTRRTRQRLNRTAARGKE
jgi:hypothetical protein